MPANIALIDRVAADHVGKALLEQCVDDAGVDLQFALFQQNVLGAQELQRVAHRCAAVRGRFFSGCLVRFVLIIPRLGRVFPRIVGVARFRIVGALQAAGGESNKELPLAPGANARATDVWSPANR